jgi:RHS repeat-associated protein
MPDDQGGFTGHIRDKATGLNYMQARYYDPVMGRFPFMRAQLS